MNTNYYTPFEWNLAAGWVGICVGMLAGVVLGLGFDRETFLGGYAGWPRRLLRLGHVSLFGIGFLNLAFALTAPIVGSWPWSWLASALLIVGAITMPLVCLLSAFWRSGRFLFPIPVTALLVSAAITGWACASFALEHAS